jgi:hypothetical protein
MVRFNFCAIAGAFSPAFSISSRDRSSALVQGRPAGRGPVISPSPSAPGYNPTSPSEFSGRKHEFGRPGDCGSIDAPSLQRLFLTLPTLGGAGRRRSSRVGCLSLATPHFQPELDQPADGLTARQFPVCGNPPIDGGQFWRVPALTNLNALTCRGRTSFFLCYHGCLCHKPW